MKISAKIEYACRAILELAIHWPNAGPVQINTIATHQNIPMKFLTHILIHLKELGYVESTRGKMGGYVLTQSPKDIKLCDVIQQFGGLGLTHPKNKKKKMKNDFLTEIWEDVEHVVCQKLKEWDFELIKEQYEKNKHIMFVI